MTYRDILDATMPELEDKHLERYVAGYEGGTLAHDCAGCAVGHMNRGSQHTDEGAAYVEYMRTTIAVRECPLPEYPPLQRIELVFEGYYHWVATSDYGLPAPDRRRLIYDACVEELAKRASVTTPPVTLTAPMVRHG
jgi:hypothetical protein